LLGQPLQDGALYFNTTDDTMYVFNGSIWIAAESTINIVSVPTQLAADLTTNGNDIIFGDNDKAVFGAGSDLQIFHDGSNSYIDEVGTGNLLINANNLRLRDTSGNPYFLGNSGAEVRLYYNGSTKVQTTSTGIDVTGVITTDGMTTSADINFGDNDKAIFGAGSDLQIYHDGSDSIVKDAGNGNLKLQGSSYVVIQNASNTNMIRAQDGAAVRLYHNGSEKLDTTSTGIDVSGTVTADGLTVSGDSISFNTTAGELDINPLGGGSVEIESSGTLGVKVGGTSGFLVTDSSDNNIFKAALSGDISFYEDTGTTPKFFWDASAEALGIGTSSPDALVHLSATADAALRFEATDTTINSGQYYGRLEFEGNDAGTSAGGIRARIDALSTGQNGESALVFNTSGVGSDSDNEAMRIDSSGNVGIGESSPEGNLHVKNGSAGAFTASGSSQLLLENNTTVRLTLISPTTNSTKIEFGDINDQDIGTIDYSHFDDSMRFGTNASERMRIDSSGNVGIGQAPTAFANWKVLELKGGTSGAMLNFENSASTRVSTVAYDDGNDALRIQNFLANPITFETNNTERMRIASDGHLLVGKTSSESTNTVGFEVKDNGIIAATADGSQPLILNRKTSDGTIAQFRKDNSTVGSIGVASSVIPYFVRSSGSVGGIALGGGATKKVFPCDTNGAGADNTIDLGDQTNRFKDLYLSGGAYLGGTAAANHLDDYEEGTFDAEFADAETGGNTASIATLGGTYVKVGSLVTINMYMLNIDTTGLTATNSIFIRNLPFVAAGGETGVWTGSMFSDRLTFTDMAAPYVFNGKSFFKIMNIVSNGADSELLVSSVTSGNADLYFSLSYRV
jgi:hypothetical protein